VIIGYYATLDFTDNPSPTPIYTIYIDTNPHISGTTISLATTNTYPPSQVMTGGYAAFDIANLWGQSATVYISATYPNGKMGYLEQVLPSPTKQCISDNWWDCWWWMNMP
jgi:hypothetical protein